MTKEEFFREAIPAALEAGHLWPEYAACEAALESAWGESKLAKEGNNLFGQKHGFTTQEWPVLIIPTKENVDLNHDGIVSPDEVVNDHNAQWACFPDWATSFRERMEVLRRMSCYRNALNAIAGETFVTEVSKYWATDPLRAAKVLTTYRVNKRLIQQVSANLQ